MRSMLCLAMIPMFVGCATIVGGTNQTISVETRTEAGPVTGVQCKLINNKGSWTVITPGMTTVNRSYEDLAVTCEKPGVPTGIASVKSSTKGMAFGNIIFGGLIGASVDVSSGAAYDYPTLLNIEMGKTIRIAVDNTAPAPAAPTAPVAPQAPAAPAASGAQ